MSGLSHSPAPLLAAIVSVPTPIPSTTPSGLQPYPARTPSCAKLRRPVSRKKPSLKPPAATRTIVAQAKLATQLYSLGASKTLKHNVLKRADSLKTSSETPPAATSLLHAHSSRLETSRALKSLQRKKKRSHVQQSRCVGSIPGTISWPATIKAPQFIYR